MGNFGSQRGHESSSYVAGTVIKAEYSQVEPLTCCPVYLGLAQLRSWSDHLCPQWISLEVRKGEGMTLVFRQMAQSTKAVLLSAC